MKIPGLAKFPSYFQSNIRKSSNLNIVLQYRSFTGSSILRNSDMETVNTSTRLESLRKLMRERKVDVYIVPSEDSHQSEYIAPCDARREFISGFTGSAGTAVITLEKAALSTDGRYFNQAAQQLDSNWTLLKQGMQDVPTWKEWAALEAEKGKTVGIDPLVITNSDAKKLSEKLGKRSSGELKAVEENLIDIVWGADRPARPVEKVKVLDEKYAGKSFKSKLDDLRQELERQKKDGIVITMLDEIAWLFNLRGNDIPYNPVFFSYALVTPTDATLYVDESKLDSDVRPYLGNAVQIKPYDALLSDLMIAVKSSGSDQSVSGAKYLISTKASWALALSLGELGEEVRSHIGDAKAIKNDTELEGMRSCHIRDGAALSEYFAWLERQMEQGVRLDESEAADKLELIRSKNDLFVGLSFDTISSTGPNAAVIHYFPEKGKCSVIDPKAIYLCDSGAQYLDGTTDTTRTLHFGTPTEMEVKAYTLVLKGLIAIDQLVFPKGTSGYALDAFARQHLWREGLDYRHGTGHGVGSYLNVHEGPIGIGTRVNYTEVALSPGNVISDEPGFYLDSSFGIRIENMILCVPASTTHQFGDKPFLKFECVTLVPLCRKLIDKKLLSEEETKWVNEYHQKVLKTIGPFFEGDGEDKKRTKRWLERECQLL